MDIHKLIDTCTMQQIEMTMSAMCPLRLRSLVNNMVYVGSFHVQIVYAQFLGGL